MVCISKEDWRMVEVGWKKKTENGGNGEEGPTWKK